MSSTWKGAQLTLSIFGQSHGTAIGMNLDGIPSGEAVDLAEIQAFLDRRAPGKNAWSTPRKESDIPQFLSGLLENITCAAPLAALFYNQNTRSGDYASLHDVPRPGHADFTAQVKYKGFQDVAGGGHFSGRLTAPLCLAGAICLQLLQKRGISIFAHIKSIHTVEDAPLDPVQLSPALGDRLKTTFPVLDSQQGEQMQACIAEARSRGDSVGGVIECAVWGLPVGLGEPMFDGMENRLAQMLFAVPAIKGVEFGAGFGASRLYGSQNNDAFYYDGTDIKTKTNQHGGILGGISSGMPLVLRVAVKPTPSIALAQESISFSTGQNTTLRIQGRHDPCIVPRAVPCIEAATALVVLDALLEHKTI